jgi:lipopolysaccharide/colanic/teichoic acid biosynthesis glycosyltransferase
MKYAAKRLTDVLISIGALALLAPLMLLIACAVRFSSPGPVFFRQARLGRRGRPFYVLKFRTMVENAPDIRNPDGSTYSGDDDPRVTAVGRWLRSSSLDEAPQLWNVLMGEMSIVGPRPDQVDQLRFYSTEDRRKLEVRPGITGLAQISGRNAIPWEERRRLDCQYVKNWSFWLDMKILAMTLPYVLMRKDINQNSGRDQSKRSASPAT